MGTSKNVASPDIPPWRFALAVLGRLDVPAQKQNLEIWRSVQAERGSEVIDDFSQPALAAACRLASEVQDVQRSVRAFEEYLADEGKSGFAIELGKRALVRAVRSNAGADGFARELFAEATSYYVSRDLPSFVGRKGRVDTVSAAISLKSNLTETTRGIVRAAGVPSVDPRGWADYVSNVFRRLGGAR